jgi:alpha-galactosidase
VIKNFCAVVGSPPPQLHELTIEANITGRSNHAKHVAMLDPQTAAELSLEETSDLLEAHGEWVPSISRSAA